MFSISLLFSKGTSSLKSMVIKVPEVARSGDTVTLTCNYDLEQVPLYSIKWYRNGEEFYRYVPKESPPFRAFLVRYINVDITRSGENDVTLRGVRRELTGDYKCEVSADGPRFHTDILSAHMTVVELPNGNPVMNIEPTKVEIGKKIVAECFSQGSDPAANITWFINGEQVYEDSPNILIHPTWFEYESSLGLNSSKSKLEVIATKSHFLHGVMSIRCEATIFALWRQSAEDFVRDDTPRLAPVLGSTSSQSHVGSHLEMQNGARWTCSLPSTTTFLACFLFSIIYDMLR
ncbi:uncharacterized protein LOC132697019 isoform X2 [Cylas formicarius]|uniref:uncharacterized protein LOC132697019 isoform X2 n=1 Tax=Cylas formicarius TaxID=197179 RepID=UPI002958C799|nr:uncharacterized protein LOC132697019 isoform X2 [Cylas formicarius]